MRPARGEAGHVCVCGHGQEGGSRWHGFGRFGHKGPPSVFSPPWSRSQGILGRVSRAINFSSVLEMTFWRYGRAKPGRGGSADVTLRAATAWSALGELYQRWAFKYHSAPPPPTTLHFPTLQLTHNSLSFSSCHHLFFLSGPNEPNCGWFYAPRALSLLVQTYIQAAV